MASRKSCENLNAIQRSDQKLCYFNPLLKSGRLDLFVTELGFHINPKVNGLWKLVQKFERDPLVWSKMIAILTRYSSLADHTSTPPSSDYIEIPWKQPLETRAKI